MPANLVRLGRVAHLRSVYKVKGTVLVHTLKHFNGKGWTDDENRGCDQDEKRTLHPFSIVLPGRILERVLVSGLSLPSERKRGEPW